MRIRWLLLLVLFLIPLSAQAQGVRVGDNPQVTSSPISGGQLFAVANANISFCSHPANAVPCTNKATTYTDITLGTPCSTSTQIVLAGTSTCVANSDGLGNWGVWVAAGTYDYTIQLPGGGAIGPYTVTLSGAGGGFTAGLDLAGTSLAQQVIGLHFGVNAIQLASSLQTGCVQITGTAINGTGIPCITSTISTPAGSDTQIQFNKSNVMGATSGLGVDSSTSPSSLQIPFNESVEGPRPRRDVTSPQYAGGADPTHTSDSTAAIQAAINAACAAGGLGDVFFPPGNYKIAASTTSAPQLSIPKSCSALHFVGGNGSIAPDKAQFETPPQSILYTANCSGAGTGPMFLLENGSQAAATQGGTGSTFSNLGIVGCNQGLWAFGVANVTFNNIAFGNTNNFGADPYSLKITNSFFVYINGGTINNYNTTVAGVLLDAETPLGTEPSEANIINFRNTIFNGAVLLDQRVSTPNQSGAILFDGVQAEIGGSSVPFFTTQCEASCNAFGPLNISYSGVSDNNPGTPLVQLRGFARYNDITIIDSNGSATGSPAINADNAMLNCMVIGGAFSSRTVVNASGAAQSGCVQQNINGLDFTSAASSFPSGADWTTSFLTQSGFFGGNQGPAIRMAVPGDTQSRLALDPNAGLAYGPGGSGSGGWDTEFFRSGTATASLSLASVVNTFPGTAQFTFNTTGLGINNASPAYALDVTGTLHGTSYFDITETAAPANPAAGTERLWADSTSHLFTCKISTGASCSSGGGGGGPLFQVNGTALTSSSTVNYQNSAVTNGLTLGFNNPSAGNVQLTLSGVCTIAMGCTGQSTANSAFNALAPSTSNCGFISANGVNSYGNLACGANGTIPTVVSGALVFQAPTTISTTGSPLSGQGTFFSAANTVTGSVNWTYSASGGHAIAQGANGTDVIYANRFTDSSPTGNYLHFQNAAKTTDIFKVDISGNLTAVGSATYGSGATSHFLQIPEGIVTGCASGFDTLSADATSHTLQACNNNGGFASVVLAGVDVNSSFQVTATHLTGMSTGAIPKVNASGGLVTSFLSDNATNGIATEDVDFVGNAHINECTNDVSTGTTNNLLMKFTSTGCIKIGTGDTAVPVFIVKRGGATSGAGQYVAGGIGPCTMDTTVVSNARGYYVIASTGTGAQCHPQAAAPAIGTYVVGQVFDNSTSSGSAANVDTTSRGFYVAAAAGTGTVTSIATSAPLGGGTITTTGTLTCATCVTSSSPGAGVAHFVGATQAVTSSAVVGADMTNNTVTATQLAAQYSKWEACNGPGLGDGLNAIPAGTYVQFTCVNTTGVTVTLTGLSCFTDNAGSSTMNAANNAGTGLLTGVVTCNNTKSAGGAAGTQSATTTLAAGDAITFTFVADGTSKQTNWTVKGTY